MRLILAAATLIACAAPAAAQMRVYPALRSGDAAYVVDADSGGRIRQCRPAKPALVPDPAPACAALTARGLPAEVVPAKSITDPATWVTFDDYPPDALRREVAGTTRMIFEVDDRGRVAECRAYASSGHADLDTAACAALVARARFSPATYKGQPVRALGIVSFSFSVR
jgi:TonB family protein